MLANKIISVVMSTHNGERFLRQQLDSVLNQSRLPDEFVVCDDASTDSTLDMLEDFKNNAPFPVHIHRNASNIGWGASFMNMSKRAEGDLIVFCDQDDVWNERKLEMCEIPFKDEKVVMVVHSYENVDSSLDSFKPRHGEFFKGEKRDGSDLPLLIVYTGMSIVCKTEIFYKFEFLRQEKIKKLKATPSKRKQVPHDLWCYHHDRYVSTVAKILGDVVFISDVLALRRIHDSNETAFVSTSLSTVGKYARNLNSDNALYYRDISLALMDDALLFKNAAAHNPELEKLLLKEYEIYVGQSKFFSLRADLIGSLTPACNKVKILFSRIFTGQYINRPGISMSGSLKSLLKDIIRGFLSPRTVSQTGMNNEKEQ